ncbi:MAG: cupin domain-containing carboxymuconolactone decarboxylase family protein [Candidatus Spyradenecus sp.]
MRPLCLSLLFGVLAMSPLCAQSLSPFPQGEPNTAYAAYFTGSSHLARLTTRHAEHGIPIANVTFEPGCRNHWHRHSQGQLLIAVGGEGLYQARGEAARLLRPGDIVEIPGGVDHWHGATATRPFAHLAIEVKPSENQTTWFEAVTDADYAAAQPQPPPAPALLTPRQVALARLAATTAIGDLEAVKAAAEAGLEGGLTLAELKEALLHTQAYAGFPRCLNGYATLAALCEERRAAGLPIPEGPEPTRLPPGADRERLGRERRARLCATDPNAAPAPWQRFAPGAEQFLKEHLFCDLFERGILSEADRELCTVAILTALPGVEAQLASHRAIAKRLGLSDEAYAELQTLLHP